MSDENNNEIVLNEENNFMNAYKKIPFMPFPSKQKEYVSNYNKNRYRRQKHSKICRYRRYNLLSILSLSYN